MDSDLFVFMATWLCVLQVCDITTEIVASVLILNAKKKKRRKIFYSVSEQLITSVTV